MKLRLLPALFIIGSVSMQAQALAPVVNNPGYPAPAPNQPITPKPAPANPLYEVMGRLEQLQREVQQLTGKVEELTYNNAELKKRLSTMYSDFDDRLHSVESKQDGTQQADAENQENQNNAEANQDETKNQPDSEPPTAEAGDEQIQEAPAPQQSEAPQIPDDENQDYQQAYDALRNGRTEQSIAAFKAYLQKYPSGQLASNAQYWLGEAYRVNQNSDSARQAFNDLINNYPDSTKVPDALLKLGYVEFDLKDWGKAREYLTRVTADFPKSTAARLASKKLHLIENAQP